MKTVFIIGAGASSEVRLPVGTELKKHIADALTDWPRKDSAISDVLTDLSNRGNYDLNKMFQASSHICNAMPQAPSIDNFLNTHPNDELIELCGKLAIAHTIVVAESGSSLYIHPTNMTLKFSLIEEIWLNSFMQLLTEDCSLQDLKSRLASICLIIFNYDRCVEHYIYHWIQNYYGIVASDAAKLLKEIEIYHPYGTVGSLPCLGSGNTIEFGVKPHATKLLGLASQIKTFTEGTDEESSDILSIRQHVKTSPRLVFLGFAFHRINMKLLFPEPEETVSNANRKIFGTAFGLSGRDRETIASELVAYGKFNEENIYLQRLTCRQLFREHKRDLSFV
jgi:hypothetical protein